MKRTWIGGGLLALLIAAGILAGSFMERRICPHAETIRRAGAASLAGDWEKAEALTDSVRAKWMRSRKAAAGLADHEILEQIDLSFAQLAACAGADGPTYSALCAALASQLEVLGRSHQCSWENLL